MTSSRADPAAVANSHAGRRRIAAYLQGHGHAPAVAAWLAERIHADKTARFVDLVRHGRVPARLAPARLAPFG